MTIRGCAAVVAVECSKLAAQVKARAVLAACAGGPFAFAVVIRAQSSVPEDTLFGRSVGQSGFAVPLVVLGFAALWVFPVLATAVGGDVFAAEDRYGTWKTMLTRSRSRSEMFAGKVAAALAFSLIAVGLLAISSVAAGVLVVGAQPLVGLSGSLLRPSQALTRVMMAWTAILPPTCALTAVAVLVSVASRSSVAGIGVPVAAALIMQLYAMVDGPEIVRRLLMTSAFGAWHGLLFEPPDFRALVNGTMVSGAYAVVCLALAYRLLQKRDVAG